MKSSHELFVASETHLIKAEELSEEWQGFRQEAYIWVEERVSGVTFNKVSVGMNTQILAFFNVAAKANRIENEYLRKIVRHRQIALRLDARAQRRQTKELSRVVPVEA